MTDNRTLYRTVEFDSWAHRSQLITAENFLIDNYLEKSGETLEAGTGGGKILFELKRLGFSSLSGFDFIPEFIEHARRRDTTNSIRFEVGDAVSLRFQDASFDQIIYLQQIICLISDEVSRSRALEEAHRILREGGIALFSFLSFEARKSSLYGPFITYLKYLRKLRRSALSTQYLPWLKRGGKFNFDSLFDIGPYLYWYRLEEVCRLLGEVGFQVAAAGSSHQIGQGRMLLSCEALADETIEGMLYFVCKK